MSKIILSVLILASVTSFADSKNTRKPNQQASIELDAAAAKKVGNLLRKANQKGDKSVQFTGGPQVTTYSVGNLTCYFQNSDDSVSCSIGQ